MRERNLAADSVLRMHLARPRDIQVRQNASFAALGCLQIFGFGATSIGLNFEAHLLAFIEAGHAGFLQSGDMDEHVLGAVIGGNKPITSCGIEEFHGTCSHYVTFKVLRCPALDMSNPERKFTQRFKEKMSGRERREVLPERLWSHHSMHMRIEPLNCKFIR